MRESRTYRSVRGALSNGRPYRDPHLNHNPNLFQFSTCKDNNSYKYHSLTRLHLSPFFARGSPDPEKNEGFVRTILGVELPPR